MEPLIINLAPTGMVPRKAMTPHVPESVEEILEDVHACSELGVSIVHVHAREDDGSPTHRAEAFAPIVEGIRRLDPDLVVCVTCSGRRVGDFERRAEVLELSGDAKPDMASLTLGSNNFRHEVSANPPEVIEGLAARMRERRIRPELEAFEPGMVQFGRHLERKGLIEAPCYVNVLLGNVATSPLAPGSLAAFLALMPDSWTWAAGGFGGDQLGANLMAIAAGGHVRVGLEDNIWWDRERTEPATNAMLVERVQQLAELAGRPIATPGQVRERLGLVQRPAMVGGEPG
jgi:uncharacterized protein (DUF849 family)